MKNKLEIIGIIENASVELEDLLDLAQSYTQYNLKNKDIKNIDLILDKMQEHASNLKTLFINGEINNLLKD